MDGTFASLLELDWALDVDATMKVLYGHQAEARVGYNPTKPGRPSPVYQTHVYSTIVLAPGNQNASEYAQPTLFGWLDARDRKHWPKFVRGDIAYGNENMTAGLEQRKLPYLIKLRQSENVSRTIARLARHGDKVDWQSSGQGWDSLQG